MGNVSGVVGVRCNLFIKKKKSLLVQKHLNNNYSTEREVAQPFLKNIFLVPRDLFCSFTVMEDVIGFH